MLIGSHTIIYTKDAEADRKFLRDVLKLPSVDVGEGWLIFGLPPSEVACHPHDENNFHAFYLMCEDIDELITTLTKRKVTCAPVQDEGWGLLTEIKLPGGGALGIYQPRHARPESMQIHRTAKKKDARKPKAVKKKKAAKKKSAKKAGKKKTKRR